MSDDQLYKLLGFLGVVGTGFVAFAKWAFTQWMSDRREEREDRKEDRKEDREATKAVAAAMTTMALKFDAFDKRLAEMHEDFEEISGVRPAPTSLRRVATPARGVGVTTMRAPRAGTHHDPDD